MMSVALEGAVNVEQARTSHSKPAFDFVETLIREQNVAVLQRALQAEIDPDHRRVIRRLLREQERIAAALKFERVRADSD
jgi:hypothetical protein